MQFSIIPPTYSKTSFQNLLRRLRCEYETREEKCSTNQSIIIKIIIKRKNVKLFTEKGIGKNKNDALKDAVEKIWDDLNLIPDPCKKQKKYMKLFKHVLENEKIIAFRSPPDDWFSQSQILGIDFEGSPPTIAQIACEKGVFISRVNKPKVIEILKDPKHIHCVFGKHEEELVGNPLNLQIDPHKSLVEYISITFCPEIRFKKDKKIHKKVGYWKRYIPDFGLRYAALDAEMTRLLGMIKYSENTNPFSGKIKPFNIDTEAVFQKFKKLYNS